MSSTDGPGLPPPRLGVSAAVFRDGHVLLVERAKPPLKGVWSLPGGHMSALETALAAAHRELLEETGVEADLKGVTAVRDVMLRHDDGSLRARYVLTVFYGIWRRGEARAASDCRDARWVEPAALGAYPLTEGLRPIIANAAALLARSTHCGRSRLKRGT